MKYINFTKLHVKNFLSVGDEPVVVEFNRGLNIITGLNKDKEDRRNGVGKSTIADAIYFAVFGNTIRELKKEHVTNNVTQNRCEVSLDFECNNNGQHDVYRVVRTLNPTKCYLYKNDDDKTRDSISNTNELISEIINSSPEVFQNCVIMTINNTTPFMAKKKLEKRKFIEGIFNLQVFSSMLANARSEANEVMKDFNVDCARYEEVSNTLDAYTSQQKEQDSQREQSVAKYKQRKKTNTSNIKTHVDKLKSIVLIDKDTTSKKVNQLTDAKNKVKQMIVDQQNKIVQVTTKMDILNEKLAACGTNETICPTCLRPIDKDDVEHIEREKKKLVDQLHQLDETKTSLSGSRFEYDDKLEAVTSAIKKLEAQMYKDDLNRQEITNIKNSINQLRELNLQIDSDLDQLKQGDNGLKTLIESTGKKLEQIQQAIDTLKQQISVFEVVKFIVSEEGVKSYIVKKILQLFNSKLAYYLKKMDANCICVFNEYFEENIIDEKGKICSYFNFSGAERKNIDLACLFAFMDIRRLQGDVAFNFSIYDELFDSSLDEKGVDLVTEILKERIEKYKECIMVISHRKESVKSATGEIIFLEKKNGITTRVSTPEMIDA